MWNVTLKSILAHKMRLVSTSIAVMLGVAFVAGSLVLSATIDQTFNDLFANVYKHTSVVVRGQSTLSGGEAGDQRVPVDESLLSSVRAVPGVKVAEGIISGYTQLTDKNGKAMGGNGPPSIGGIWHDTELNPFNLVAGSGPTNDNEVVIDNASAKKANYHVGDTITVLTDEPPAQFRISGIVKFGQVDSPGGASFALFTQAAAQHFAGQPGKFDNISIGAQPGVSQAQLRARVAAALPASVDVVTGAQITKEQQDQLQKALSVFGTFLLVFAGIALFVAAFIINNTFSILVAQRTREMALLRAIGARSSQVRRSVLVESFAVGLVASVLGLVVGIGVAAGLKELFSAIGIDLPASGLVVNSTAIITSFVAGISVTMVSAFLPARKAARVPPIAALRDVAIDRTGSSRARAGIGVIVTTIGLGLLALGLFGSVKKPYIPVGFGVGLTFIGIYVLGPIFARPLSALIGFPIPMLKGMTGVLARENAMRNPRRTSATAAALMVGVTLVTFLSVFAESAKSSANRTIDQSLAGDFVVQAGRNFQGGLNPQLAQQIGRLPQVKLVSAVRYAPMEVDSKPTAASAIDPLSFSKIFDAQVSQGSFSDLGTSEIAIDKDTASSKNWKLGQRIPVRFLESGVQQFRIVAIYDSKDVLGSYTIGLPSYDANFPKPFDSLLMIMKASGASADSARSAIEPLVSVYPTAKLQDHTQFKADTAKQIDQVLNIMFILLALAVLIALLGIANTLALSIFERTRELGLLRAVGMTRRQIRSMVRWESVIIALLGTLLGLVIGVAFGWAMVTALSSQGISVLTIPSSRLVVVAIVAAIAGVVAAIVPARRAARLNVLDAISTS